MAPLSRPRPRCTGHAAPPPTQPRGRGGARGLRGGRPPPGLSVKRRGPRRPRRHSPASPALHGGTGLHLCAPPPRKEGPIGFSSSSSSHPCPANGTTQPAPGRAERIGRGGEGAAATFRPAAQLWQPAPFGGASLPRYAASPEEGPAVTETSRLRPHPDHPPPSPPERLTVGPTRCREARRGLPCPAARGGGCGGAAGPSRPLVATCGPLRSLVPAAPHQACSRAEGVRAVCPARGVQPVSG